MISVLDHVYLTLSYRTFFRCLIFTIHISWYFNEDYRWRKCLLIYYSIWWLFWWSVSFPPFSPAPCVSEDASELCLLSTQSSVGYCAIKTISCFAATEKFVSIHSVWWCGFSLYVAYFHQYSKSMLQGYEVEYVGPGCPAQTPQAVNNNNNVSCRSLNRNSCTLQRALPDLPDESSIPVTRCTEQNAIIFPLNQVVCIQEQQQLGNVRHRGQNRNRRRLSGAGARGTQPVLRAATPAWSSPLPQHPRAQPGAAHLLQDPGQARFIWVNLVAFTTYSNSVHRSRVLARGRKTGSAAGQVESQLRIPVTRDAQWPVQQHPGRLRTLRAAGPGRRQCEHLCFVSSLQFGLKIGFIICMWYILTSFGFFTKILFAIFTSFKNKAFFYTI